MRQNLESNLDHKKVLQVGKGYQSRTAIKWPTDIFWYIDGHSATLSGRACKNLRYFQAIISQIEVSIEDVM